MQKSIIVENSLRGGGKTSLRTEFESILRCIRSYHFDNNNAPHGMSKQCSAKQLQKQVLFERSEFTCLGLSRLSWICSTLTEFRYCGYAAIAQSVRYPDSLRSVRPQIRYQLLSECSSGRSFFGTFLSTQESTYKKKYAFTLAEVLITLGIIGVVAAMTLPTLIQNYKKQALISRLKKAYSEVYQALVMAEAEHGNHQEWDYGIGFNGDSAAKFVDTYMAPYLKLTKNCGKEAGCINGNIYSLDGINSGFGDSVTDSAKVITASGYSLLVTSGGYYVTIRIILPNNKNDQLMFGKNVFDYQSVSTTKGLMGVDPNITREAMMDNSNLQNCAKIGGRYSGMNCGQLILKDGWEIKDDYPVKF